MKTNEIILEVGAISRALAGTTAGIQKFRSRQNIAKLAKDSFRQWNERTAGDPATANDPDKLYSFAQKMAPRVKNLPPPPASITPANVLQYFDTVTGLALAGPSYRDAPEAEPTSTIGSTHANPKAATKLEIKGHEYNYNPGTRAWTNEAGASITNPNDIEILNQKAYEQAKAGTQQPSANTEPAQVAGQPATPAATPTPTTSAPTASTPTPTTPTASAPVTPTTTVPTPATPTTPTASTPTPAPNTVTDYSNFFKMEPTATSSAIAQGINQIGQPTTQAPTGFAGTQQPSANTEPAQVAGQPATPPRDINARRAARDKIRFAPPAPVATPPRDINARRAARDKIRFAPPAETPAPVEQPTGLQFKGRQRYAPHGNTETTKGQIHNGQLVKAGLENLDTPIVEDNGVDFAALLFDKMKKQS